MNTYSGSESDKLALGEGIAILKFHATWCGPCKKLAPHVSKLASDISSNSSIVFFDVDIDEHPTLSERFDIEAVPTVIKLVNGKVDTRWVGGECNLQSIQKSLEK